MFSMLAVGHLSYKQRTGLPALLPDPSTPEEYYPHLPANPWGAPTPTGQVRPWIINLTVQHRVYFQDSRPGVKLVPTYFTYNSQVDVSYN